MTTWVALIRGVNVTGRNRVVMKELVADLAAAGFSGVRTYLQSGNVVLQSRLKSATGVAARVADAIESRNGFRPAVMAVERTLFRRIMAENPFPEAVHDPARLHVYFIASPAEGHDRAGIERLRKKSEAWRLTDSACYLHTPEGFGTSRLAAGLEKLLGVKATARNWRTVDALAGMLDAPPA